MAAIGFTIAGAVLAPFTGGGSLVIAANAAFVAGFATVGSLIDQKFLYPAIFGKPDSQNGARVDDIRIQRASEGSPINYVLGTNKVAGLVMWRSPIRKEVHHNAGPDNDGTDFHGDLAVAVADCDQGSILEVTEIWANELIIFKDGVVKDTSIVEDVEIYLGSDDQLPSPTIESDKGIGNVPAFRGTAYIVFKNINYSYQKFGNSTPNFTFKINQSPTVSVQDAITLLATRGRITSDYIDVSRIAADSYIHGYSISGVNPAAQTIEPILLGWVVDAQEYDGLLYFFDQDHRNEYTIKEGDLGTINSGEDVPPSFTLDDPSEMDLPSEVDITYLDLSRGYEQGMARAKRLTFTHINVSQLDLPLVTTSVFASNMATRALWKAWGQRHTAKFSLPATYMMIREGDLLTVPFNGVDYSLRVAKSSVGANFMVQIEATVEQEIPDDVSVVDDLPSTDQDPYTAPDLTVMIADIANVKDADFTTIGFYIGACLTDASNEWRGAEVFVSYDSGDTYRTTGVVLRNQSTVGETTSTLANPSGGYATAFDSTHTVDILLNYGEVSSAVTDADVTEVFDNHMLIGAELVGFVNATLNSPGAYTLDRLVRGSRNTTPTSHSSPETVMLFDTTIKVVKLNRKWDNQTIYVKVVPTGASIDDVAPKAFTFQSRLCRPWAPVNANFSRDGSNNLTITWDRTPSGLVADLSGDDDGITGAFSVDIWSDNTRTTRVRHVGTSYDLTPAILYTAAQQTTDGFTPGDHMYVTIYEKNQILGRGDGLEADG